MSHRTFSPANSSQNSLRAPRLFLIPIGIELIVFILLCHMFFWYTPDDGYIYLSGARQIASGQVPNFCPGEEPANFFGSILWALVLTPPFILDFDPLIWGKVIGLILLLSSALVLSGIVKMLAHVRGLVAATFAFLLLCFPPAIVCAFNLLDTMLATFAMVLAVYYLIAVFQGKSSYVRLGLSLSLLLVSRPHTFIDVFLIVILAAIFIQRNCADRRDAIIKTAAGIAPGMLIACATMIIFRDIIPNSAMAKVDFSMAHQKTIATMTDLLGLFVQRLQRDFSRDPILYASYASLLPFIVIMRNRHIAVSMAMLSLTHLAVYVFNGESMGAHRIWLPSLFVSTACFFSVILAIIGNKMRAVIMALLLIVVFPMSRNFWRTWVDVGYYKPGSDAEQIGTLIHKYKNPDSWLLTPDMGVTVYFADMPTIDTCDTPICNKHRRRHPYDMKYIAGHQVDFVILITGDSESPKYSREVKHKMCRKVFESKSFVGEYTAVTVGEHVPRQMEQDGQAHKPRRSRYIHLYARRDISGRIGTANKER